MRYSVLGLSVLASLASVAADCSANNCARAVTGTSKGTATVAVHRADCSSLLQETALPPTSTATTIVTTTAPAVTVTANTVVDFFTVTVATVTGITTVTVAAPFTGITLLKRAEPTIPVYASACTSFAAYSSACSCWGIDAGTTILPAPTVTVTLTTTVTPTVSVNAVETVTIPTTATTFITSTVTSLVPI
ncbi:hypothetical protein GQ53DRAFT_874531 [Thozetella sp. PMI_491]|nr:hypothetical protein GQ53DRAFT_874531 [Thozetella sp. PMI_491]